MISSFSSSFSFGRGNGNNQFRNPPLAFGSEVVIESQSPFVGGGNSYFFIDSSNYSNGANSYITTPGSSNWAVGTEDFTVEWFGNQGSTAINQVYFGVSDIPFSIGANIPGGLFNTIFSVQMNNQIAINTTNSSPAIHTWYHWAIVRKDGTTRLYRNGTYTGGETTTEYNITDSSSPLVIGNKNPYSIETAYWGYITNFRFIKGLAVYTGNFTVPTSALTPTSIANPYGGSNTEAIGPGFTKLLLKP